MLVCVASGCKNRGAHVFPKDLKLRQQWENAIKLKRKRASKTSRLCSKHFKPEDFNTESYHTGVKLQRKILKKGVVPSISCNKSRECSTAELKNLRAAARVILKELTSTKESEPEAEVPFDGVSHEVEVYLEEDEIPVLPENNTFVNSPTVKSVGTQKNYNLFSIESFRDDNEGIKFYTGLESYEKFMFVLNTLLPEAHCIQNRWKQVLDLSVEDQFLLTLMKLRRNKQDYELAKFFDIQRTSVSNIFVTWINFIHQMWEMLDIWPSRELVDFYMPHGFAKLYPSTRAILDYSEIPIRIPANAAAQNVMSGPYNSSTVKFEVGASPTGLLSHCSEAHTGNTSYRQILETSSLLKKVEKGDSIMVDQGLNVEDLFEAKGVAVNSPTFLRSKSQLPSFKALQDRNLSCKRAHVGVTKTYRILQSPVKHQYLPLMTKIIFVCHMLCNFRESIISDRA